MNWERFKEYYLCLPDLGFSLDISRMAFPEGFLAELEARMQAAYQAMEGLENGDISNPDEERMVGHYWLRDSKRSPDGEIEAQIEDTLRDIRQFSAQIRSKAVRGQGGPFRNLLVIGIGGSALGPQFLSDALGQHGAARMAPYFLDNTDPDGFDRLLGKLHDQLGETLTAVISKSGTTPETRNGMIEVERAYGNANLAFARHALAITGAHSVLDRYAASSGWLARFPMWDWMGGRTSVTGPVGLVPAALQGFDIDALLAGAAAMDRATRSTDTRENPAALLALMWYHATRGRGEKSMVILPYKDRLALFSSYLQQLVMESLGKERNLDGEVVHQGIAVYGNKGSTDQHATVQQLREGLPDFFVTFIDVLRERDGPALEVESGITAGDYLSGFLLGTRQALYEKGRESITLSIEEVSAKSVGMLIALYERAVGFYANLINVNAYNQPGVETGKREAASILALQKEIEAALRKYPREAFTAERLASHLNRQSRTEEIFKVLEHLAANEGRRIAKRDAAKGHGASFLYLST